MSSDSGEAATSDAERVRDLELRLERETAVLIDRLNQCAAELERRGAELELEREQREQAERVAEQGDLDFNSLTLALSEAQAALAEGPTELAELAEELERTRAQLAIMERRYAGVLSSTSWRVTAPLRRFVHVYRARGERAR
jgi:septal ring factor EnvC (AmiA/AmiB activator)